ncbi:FAD-binding and (Fe-S)-binding domain-containing protein [Neptunicella sp. SCSIO 80796]|uniref:FAD-binding and (Fe-S)-binding domain-containing protein n=1 Tax=Neptunicella plasticusilytica TaxID=3117012 RepID=UPI003A4DDD4E
MKNDLTHQYDPDGFGHFVAAITPLFSRDNMLTGYLQRYAYGTDASFYRLVPRLVVKLDNLEQLAGLLTQARRWRIPITFRAAGTSLSGQAITDSVLVLLSSGWRNIDILDNGHKVRLQPGVIGAEANLALAPLGRKIGPDPASIGSCKIGGIAANNSSGMCCGVSQNSYHTLADISVVFADGSVLDTSNSASRKQFVSRHAKLITSLQQMIEELKSTPALVEKIRRKYRLKNTTGYGVNALLDFEDPVDVISHLMIGSEGTLGFIADITYHTVALPAFKATGLYLFDDIHISCQLVQLLANENVAALEIMDARALASVSHKLSALVNMPSLTDRTAGLLIEFGANSQDEFTQLQQRIEQQIASFQLNLLSCQPFTQEASLIEAMWQIRKGMFPAVGAVRATGTTVIIEDVAFPLEALADGVAALHKLFEQYAYDEAIIFGHALAGNLHFVFTQSFDSAAEIERYEHFMAAVSQLVAVEYQGSLKAEHGTGRNMAPFVVLEWGAEIYQFMQRIKQLFDPLGILNPGVIINGDPLAHLQHLKTLPAADEMIDKCIECGFCEPVCPSKNLTLTPRQRITLWRRMQELQQLATLRQLTAEEQHQQAELEQQYQYFGIDSCAATGLCAQQCPVGIDTGEFIKTLRASQQSGTLMAGLAANHFSAVTTIARFGLSTVRQANKLLGDSACEGTFKALNKLTGNAIPKWYKSWPTGAQNVTLQSAGQSSKVVFISACANRIFGPDPEAKDQRPIRQVVKSVLDKAGIQMLTLADESQMCCGMPWASKGYQDIAQRKQQQLSDAIIQLSENGRWPVVIDASPCAAILKDLAGIPLFELSEYLVMQVIEKLEIKPSAEPVVLHKTCSSLKMDKGMYLEQLARYCAENVTVPTDIHCCGFAGDKGFFVPELNASALASLKSQVPVGCQKGISNSRTCEIGLSHHAQIPYQSIVYLLDEVSRAKS